MVTRTTVLLLLGLMSLTILASCGGPPEYLDERYRKSARTLAIVAPRHVGSIVPLNMSNIEKPGRAGVGLLGGLISGLMAWEYNKGIADLVSIVDPENDSTGLFTDSLAFDYAREFDQVFLQEFQVPFELITDSSGRPFDPNAFPRVDPEEKPLLRDYSSVAAAFDADFVLVIHYRPGLALYSGRLDPSPMIAAQIEMMDLTTGETVLSTSISTDTERRRLFSAEELAADSNRVYNEEFAELVRVLAHQVAQRLGTALSMKHRSYWSGRSHLR